MPFVSINRLGAVSDIPSDHGSVVSLTADAAGDAIGASTATAAVGTGHPGGTSRFDALAPPQLVAAASAMVAIATWRLRSRARTRSDDEARPRVRVWRGSDASMVSRTGVAAACPPLGYSTALATP